VLSKTYCVVFLSFVFLCLVYPMLPVSVDCPFLLPLRCSLTSIDLCCRERWFIYVVENSVFMCCLYNAGLSIFSGTPFYLCCRERWFICVVENSDLNGLSITLVNLCCLEHCISYVSLSLYSRTMEFL